MFQNIEFLGQEAPVSPLPWNGGKLCFQNLFPKLLGNNSEGESSNMGKRKFSFYTFHLDCARLEQIGFVIRVNRGKC